MKSKLPFVLSLLLMAGVTPVMAQAPGPSRPLFTRQAIADVVSQVTPLEAGPQDARRDWSRLQQLTGREIVLFAPGLPGRKSRIVAVEDTALTVVDLESANRPTLRIPRTDVNEIRQWIGRRGSPLGAVLGVVGGAGLGFLSSVHLAFRQCGGSCTDERVLIGASLVGMPIAGGFLGYRLPGGNRTLTTIYLRP